MSTPENKGKKLPNKGSNKNAAEPSVIGSPFHNPYTFIPFSKKPVKRCIPFPLTIDELDTDLKSGVLELEVETLSPLLCCSPTPEVKDSNQNVYHALTVGDDVIMPATSIRGALRTLMTIITGGTLGYMDEDLWLCQRRDLQLGPIQNNKNRKAFLAEVIKPGDSQHSGTIRLGETALVPVSKLDGISNFNCSDYRPSVKNPPENISQIWIESPDSPSSITDKPDEKHTWRLKLSGNPVNGKNVKCEGAFKPGQKDIELDPHFWRDYQGRNRHCFRKELKKGDLVWLEPNDPDCTEISSPEFIESIQWARWGRKGKALEKVMPEHFKPDSLRDDGCVDWVTDLFGQVPSPGKKAAGPFAGRIRPHNLIFLDARQKLINKVNLAPLSAPHPGCIAFYHDLDDLDKISIDSPLKGYKVYRNTKERGNAAPWNYNVQGIYNDKEELKPFEEQNIGKTVDLLDQGVTGKLRIAFRALSKDDIKLLITVCSLDWRLGGGKPLGLGHCRVTIKKLINEDGGEEDLNHYQNVNISKSILERIELYKKSQIPVDKLRYPRAVKKNNNKNDRSGYSWFARHASPRDGEKIGLRTIWTKDELQKKANGKDQIRAQALPELGSDSELLYGYDCIANENPVKSDGNKTFVDDIFPYDIKIHRHPKGRSDENKSQNRDTRKRDRENRKPE